MSQDRQSPQTVTEAQLQSQYAVVFIGIDANSSSTARVVPYAELYRSRTGLMETPVEHLQEAAKDEEARKSGRKT